MIGTIIFYANIIPATATKRLIASLTRRDLVITKENSGTPANDTGDRSISALIVIVFLLVNHFTNPCFPLVLFFL